MRKVLVNFCIVCLGLGLATPVKAEATPEQLTQELLVQTNRYNQASKGEKEGLKAKMMEKAQERQLKMIDLARNNPSEFLKQALNEGQLKNIPSELIDKGLVEQVVKTQGKLEVVQVDDFKGKNSTKHYYFQALQGDRQRQRVNFTNEPKVDQLQPGNVMASGISLGGQLVLANESSSNAIVQTEVVPPNPTIGDQKIALIMVNFTNDRRQFISKDQWNKLLFTDANSVANYYVENSYDQLHFSGDIFGPVVIPMEQKDGYLDYYHLADLADQALTSQGTALSDFGYRIYVFPANSNVEYYASAWATIGGYPDARVWKPVNATYNENTDNLGYKSLMAHELGHNLGLSHANLLDCGLRALGSFTDGFFSDCKQVEYGDWFDTMGWGYPYRHFSAANKRFVGWLKLEQTVKLETSGSYNLTQLESGTGLKELQIPTNSGLNYSLEYRRPMGVDSLNAYGPNVTEGVYVRLVDDSGYGGTLLIDTAPPSTGSANMSDVALIPGKSLVDIENGIYISLESQNDQEARVRITLDPNVCRNQEPQITATPTQAITEQLGSALFYKVGVTNQDSSNCRPSGYTLWGYGDGFDVLVAQSLVTLAPGESGNFDVEVKPASWRAGSLGSNFIKLQVYPGPGEYYIYRHQKEIQLDYFLKGGLGQMGMSLNAIETKTGKPQTNLSALAFDNFGRELWQGVTYEWGMSSTSINGIGDVKPEVNIASFIPTAPGVGDLWVLGRWGDQTAVKSIRVTVNPGSDLNNDNMVDYQDLIQFKTSLANQNNVNDINGDGKFDIFDYQHLVSEFGYKP